MWLALQPNRKLTPGAFYFDRAEASKHLPFAGTQYQDAHAAAIRSRLLDMVKGRGEVQRGV